MWYERLSAGFDGSADVLAIVGSVVCVLEILLV